MSAHTCVRAICALNEQVYNFQHAKPTVCLTKLLAMLVVAIDYYNERMNILSGKEIYAMQGMQKHWLA